MTPSIDHLVQLLSRLPGIGRRTARRLVFYLLKADPEFLEALGQSIATLRSRVTSCSRCGNYTEADPCQLCQDPSRDDSLLCVVTSAADLTALEGCATFRGRYHVLGGLLAPLDGIGPDALRIDELIAVVDEGKVKEVILATPPNVEGEATASYLADLLTSKVGKVTRIASGVPHGGDLELSDPVTLGQALAGRRALDGCI